MAHPSQMNDLFFNISYPPEHRPNSSVYSEIFSLEDLIHRVDASARVAQLNTIERLLKENQQWEEEISRYRRTWHGLMELLDEAFELAILVRGSLEGFVHQRAIAEQEWLAFWGISNCSSESSTWI